VIPLAAAVAPPASNADDGAWLEKPDLGLATNHWHWRDFRVSCIVGLVNADGAAVDRNLLERLTSFLIYCGPEAQQTWADGALGLGNVLLATTTESVGEAQPCSLDDSVWIAVEARIDGRAERDRCLEAEGRDSPAGVADAKRIPYAYQVWGERCLDHLVGPGARPPADAMWAARSSRARAK
jgi:asparagine synthase (glutamine-hydrolysing)